MTFVSYAQNFEDVLLHRVFGGQETGFYVDVGAFHPVDGSTTKAFYDRGWSGINIEPGSVFAELEAARPRDVNLQMAVMDHAGEIAFVEDEADRGMSHVVTNGDGTGVQRMVQCDTLEAIIRAHSRGRPVDFIKIDAEGAEAAIVRATDWRRLRPRVLLLEATLPWSSALANQEWEPKLLEQGYVRAYFDGINCFYIPEEEVSTLLRHFQVPVNVLDRVVHHGFEACCTALERERQATARLAAERTALQTMIDSQQRDVAQLAADRDAVGVALEGRQNEMVRLTVERDTARAKIESRHSEVARLTVERDTARAAVENQQSEVARLTVERDTARAAMESLQSEVARLTVERDAARAAMESLQSEVTRLTVDRGTTRAPTEGQQGKMAQPAGRGLTRRLALAAYKLVRPVVRPMAWRFRGFLIAGLSEQLRHLNQQVGASSAPSQPLHVVAIEAGQGEMRRLAAEVLDEIRLLAVEMERTLLTLALERAPERQAVDSLDEPTADHPGAGQATKPIKLLLPRGRVAEVECMAGDLSIAAPLSASGGDWEPHIRHYFDTVIQPDWTCLDIGANIGTHTLSMAVLAHAGRVLAFEANPDNFALLKRNVAGLTCKRAVIQPVHMALWDRPGVLVCGAADELLGCSFVVDDGCSADIFERRLRTVVNSDAVNETALHMRLSEVPALPLDMWLKENPLPHLHLIKLDVEGAEVRVIRGADATLRQYRPILIVEYNPACGEIYFGQRSDALFHELEARFAVINMLEPDGSLTPVPHWTALQSRLSAGKGWEDLVCVPGP
ncbi:FkbM family methyltransferase [Rhodopila globiformis]|uniref:Methyltransferase FkbM domain-containing protein n=1 Tax=Rhodopila globiformis TaxID=1071 RepID=A0A2S6NBS8_RHOGL|nr:FkbM family methyltransferase [Rhodopila globiformis]PPQ32075.1 hypothetical protein CCS01_16070 [Rhodopila globiformis]